MDNRIARIAANLQRCEKGHPYPARFDKCPQCHADADGNARRLPDLTVAEHIARLSDAELASRNNIWWNAGTPETKALYQAEEQRRGIRQ